MILAPKCLVLDHELRTDKSLKGSKFSKTRPVKRTKPEDVLNTLIKAVITLGAPTSGQFSSMRFKSSSVQSLSKNIFCPSSVAVFFLLSSSSLSLSGPMLTRPRNSTGEKVMCCSAWEDMGTSQPPVLHTKVPTLPICVILLKSSPGLGHGRASWS